jgi:putative spermidine/putrescine transport system ATP-binding protein
VAGAIGPLSPQSPSSPTSPDEDFVRFLHVDKTYDGETLVIRDLSFAMRRGEFLTLLGPSGSGKTTTLMMLAGFEQPTAGAIEMEGQALSRQPPYRRNFGMVFQDYSLFPHMTVAENVGFPLTVRRLARPELRARVRQALDLVQLAGLDDRRPAQLSGGQQQRVALARALVFQPRLVLMDEPLGALDRQLREQMQLEIKHLQKRLGITAVYVTHDQQEALTMSDRIAVFHEGRIRQLGTPDELYEQPASAFVAQFVGENNRLEGEVAGLDGRRCRVRLNDGTEVAAEAVDAAPVGCRVVLSVRPERIRVDPPAGEASPNRFAAVVDEVIYYGDHARVRLRFAGAAGLTVKVSTAGGPRPLRPGASVAIGWMPEHCRAFAAA